MAARADARGWGPGWPTSRSKDQVKVSRGGPTPVATWVHRDVALLVVEGLRRTEERGYDVRMLGGYNSRPIRGSTTTASNHSWGLAIDINWDKNPMLRGEVVTDMPKWMIDLWKGLGFGWGGDYRSRPDTMHFEFGGTPADAARRVAALSRPPLTPYAATIKEPDDMFSDADRALLSALRTTQGEDRGRLDRTLALLEQAERRALRMVADDKDGSVWLIVPGVLRAPVKSGAVDAYRKELGFDVVPKWGHETLMAIPAA